MILSCRRAHRCGAAGAEKDKADVCSVHRLFDAAMLSCSIHVVDFLAHAEFWCDKTHGVGRCSRDLTCGRVVWESQPDKSISYYSLKIWRGLHCRSISTRGTHLTLVFHAVLVLACRWREAVDLFNNLNHLALQADALSWDFVLSACEDACFIYSKVFHGFPLFNSGHTSSIFFRFFFFTFQAQSQTHSWMYASSPDFLMMSQCFVIQKSAGQHGRSFLHWLHRIVLL